MEFPMRTALSLMMLVVGSMAAACSADDGSTVAEGADGALSADAGASRADGAVSGDDQGPADVQVADDDASDDEGAWWRTDVSQDVEVPDTLQDEGQGADKGGELSISLAGMVNLDTGEGALTVQVTETATDALICEFTQEVSALGAPSSPCEACEFAHQLSFEPASLTTGDAAQCLDASLALSTRNLGHGEGDVLYLGDKGEAWVTSGTSTFAAPVWMFNMAYVSSDTGGKGDAGGCMQSCLDKGGSEADCTAYCGADKGDGGDEGDDDNGEGADDGKDDDQEYSPCADDFDPSQPCVGTWQETLCTVGAELYWCDEGVWTKDK